MDGIGLGRPGCRFRSLEPKVRDQAGAGTKAEIETGSRASC